MTKAQHRKLWDKWCDETDRNYLRLGNTSHMFKGFYTCIYPMREISYESKEIVYSYTKETGSLVYDFHKWYDKLTLHEKMFI